MSRYELLQNAYQGGIWEYQKAVMNNMEDPETYPESTVEEAYNNMMELRSDLKEETDKIKRESEKNEKNRIYKVTAETDRGVRELFVWAANEERAKKTAVRWWGAANLKSLEAKIDN